MQYKTGILFVVCLLFAACNSDEKLEQDHLSDLEELVEDEVRSIDSFTPSHSTEAEDGLDDWDKEQAELRAKILDSKKNEAVKNSILQEFYIRNVVSVQGNTLFFNISFDVHGPDCGAPDCYSTDISFNFEFMDSIVFPQTLKIKEHTHGCVDEESTFSIIYELSESNSGTVIYKNSKLDNTLVLRSYLDNTDYAQFYEVEEYFEGELVPYQSTTMTSFEYEKFLD